MPVRNQVSTLRFRVISEGVYSWRCTSRKRGTCLRGKASTSRSPSRIVDATTRAADARRIRHRFSAVRHVVRGVEPLRSLHIHGAGTGAELTLVAAPDIKSFADLRGKDIAVDGARTGYALLLRKLLADKGCATVTIHSGNRRFERSGPTREIGAAVASLLNPPFDRNLFAAGFAVLARPRNIFRLTGLDCGGAAQLGAPARKILLYYIRAFHAATRGCRIRATGNRPSACCRRG